MSNDPLKPLLQHAAALFSQLGVEPRRRQDLLLVTLIALGIHVQERGAAEPNQAAAARLAAEPPDRKVREFVATIEERCCLPQGLSARDVADALCALVARTLRKFDLSTGTLSAALPSAEAPEATPFTGTESRLRTLLQSSQQTHPLALDAGPSPHWFLIQHPSPYWPGAAGAYVDELDDVQACFGAGFILVNVDLRLPWRAANERLPLVVESVVAPQWRRADRAGSPGWEPAFVVTRQPLSSNEEWDAIDSEVRDRIETLPLLCRCARCGSFISADLAELSALCDCGTTADETARRRRFEVPAEHEMAATRLIAAFAREGAPITRLDALDLLAAAFGFPRYTATFPTVREGDGELANRAVLLQLLKRHPFEVARRLVETVWDVVSETRVCIQ